MKLLETVHAGYVAGRRVAVLATELASMVPADASVLDVGCGDGLLARAISESRRDLKVVGMDVLSRTEVAIPFVVFDGSVLPVADAAVDVVLLIDVLHHTERAHLLLAEAKRVARSVVLIKDHLTDRVLSRPILRLMDRVGNERHGVALPHCYRSRREWRDLLDVVGLRVLTWREDLALYPWPASLVFGGSLHVLLSAATSPAPE